jgi:hypothetical protein
VTIWGKGTYGSIDRIGCSFSRVEVGKPGSQSMTGFRFVRFKEDDSTTPLPLPFPKLSPGWGVSGRLKLNERAGGGSTASRADPKMDPNEGPKSDLSS